MALDIEGIYKDLHRHPELSYQEERTAGIVAEHLGALGYDVTTGLGGTGVTGVLANGDGPVVLLRADMDGLPVAEATGLDYASQARGIDLEGDEVAVMHACGHDVHVACLLGAADALAHSTDEWSGTVVLVFQPAEELGTGARAMIDAGLYDTVPRPDVVLGQHVGPIPAGTIGVHAGFAFAATDSVTITLHGRGGHGSRPETTVDPVLMAAATVVRLQSIVAREIAASEVAVVTVGTLHAGTKVNIIPAEARLEVNVRSFDPDVRARVLAAIERIVRAEAAASGAEREPDIVFADAFDALYNDPEATEALAGVFRERFGAQAVMDPGAVSGSEDVGEFATELGIPIVYWILGGADPQQFAAAMAAGTLETSIPSNHSPYFAPVLQPTLAVGVDALVTAARSRLSPAGR